MNNDHQENDVNNDPSEQRLEEILSSSQFHFVLAFALAVGLRASELASLCLAKPGTGSEAAHD
jgi:hypothetical protein